MLEPVATWAPESSEELLYLSDLDDFDDESGGEPDRAFFRSERRVDVARKYGLRFTLDGL